jgi:hypothetical protein
MQPDCELCSDFWEPILYKVHTYFSLKWAILSTEMCNWTDLDFRTPLYGILVFASNNIKTNLIKGRISSIRNDGRKAVMVLTESHCI